MPTHSTLARLAQVMTLWIAACAVGWLLWWWPHSRVLAVAGALAIAFGHAWVLAVEFLLLREVRRGDATPLATGRQLLQAWWRESLDGIVVFAWRQPWRWRAVPDHLPAVPPAGEGAGRHGIVFVHGFVCNRGFWSPWLREARARGHAFVAVNLEPVFSGIDDYVPLVDAAVERVRQATGRPPVLVCHSMGGLVARAWWRARDRADPPAAQAVAHVVTIGSPHAGTWLARFSHLPNGKQMRPDSDWLRSLQQSGVAAAGPRFTCWYANCDNIVMPPSAATLPGADNRLVRGAAHVDLAFRPEVMRGTLDLIARLEPPGHPPQALAGAGPAHRKA